VAAAAQRGRHKPMSRRDRLKEQKNRQALAADKTMSYLAFSLFYVTVAKTDYTPSRGDINDGGGSKIKSKDKNKKEAVDFCSFFIIFTPTPTQ
jgi:hypothetical protein